MTRRRIIAIVSAALLATLAALPAGAFTWPLDGGRRCWMSGDATWIKLTFTRTSRGTYLITGRNFEAGSNLNPVTGTAVLQGDTVFMTWTESRAYSTFVRTATVAAQISRATGNGTGHVTALYGDLSPSWSPITDAYKETYGLTSWSCTEAPTP